MKALVEKLRALGFVPDAERQTIGDPEPHAFKKADLTRRDYTRYIEMAAARNGGRG